MHSKEYERNFERDRELTIDIAPDLFLKLVTLEDAETILELVTANREFLGKWVAWANDKYDEAFNKQFIQHNLDAYDAGTAYAMGIYSEGKLVGVVDIRNLDEKEDPEVGYWLVEEAQGKGLATISAQALIDYAKQRHGIKKVVLHTMKNNDASSRVAERLGFLYVGEVMLGDVHEKRFEKEL